MRIHLRNFCMGLLAIWTFSANAQDLINPGIWQAFFNPLSSTQYPEIRGRLCNFYWRDIQPAPNKWNWTAFDNDLASRTRDGLPVIFMVYVRGPKGDAPEWLYDNGVPKVTIRTNGGNVTGSTPYYADATYKSYFKEMISTVRRHVETLPSSVRNKIIGVQGCFGSTGDYISYGGGQVSSQYDLTQKDFSNLYREFTRYYYDEYKNTNPRITLLSNPKNKGKDDALWTIQNCPGSWLKNGTLGKAFQLNDELDKASWLYDIANKPRNGSYLRMRCEISGGSTLAGWWKKFPYKNMFAVMCYDIHWGLDWPNQDFDGLTDPLFDSSFRFFNKYAGQKDATKSTNAMCAFKDALDASDGERFPASTYGMVSRNNQQRYRNILNDYTAYGALLEDANTATLEEMDQLGARGTNDVGWRIFPANYERYLHQLTPNQTSVGYWNVQSADAHSMYGRFARGFDVSRNKETFNFDVDDAFLNNTPLNGRYPVTIEITYLDKGGGRWQLYYDAKDGSNEPSIEVTCGSTNTWKKATVTLPDAYFGNRGQNGSDFSIRSTNNKDVIFAVVELSRPRNFANAMSSLTAANSSDAQITAQDQLIQPGDGLSIIPNPATGQCYIELKNHRTITDVEIYNQAGQLVLHKKVSGYRVYIRRDEIGNVPGLYIVKVISGKKGYSGKLTLL